MGFAAVGTSAGVIENQKINTQISSNLKISVIKNDNLNTQSINYSDYLKDTSLTKVENLINQKVDQPEAMFSTLLKNKNFLHNKRNFENNYNISYNSTIHLAKTNLLKFIKIYKIKNNVENNINLIKDKISLIKYKKVNKNFSEINEFISEKTENVNIKNLLDHLTNSLNNSISNLNALYISLATIGGVIAAVLFVLSFFDFGATAIPAFIIAGVIGAVCIIVSGIVANLSTIVSGIQTSNNEIISSNNANVIDGLPIDIDQEIAKLKTEVSKIQPYWAIIDIPNVINQINETINQLINLKKSSAINFILKYSALTNNQYINLIISSFFSYFESSKKITISDFDNMNNSVFNGLYKTLNEYCIKNKIPTSTSVLNQFVSNIISILDFSKIKTYIENMNKKLGWSAFWADLSISCAKTTKTFSKQKIKLLFEGLSFYTEYFLNIKRDFKELFLLMPRIMKPKVFIIALNSDIKEYTNSVDKFYLALLSSYNSVKSTLNILITGENNLKNIVNLFY